jgi:hypothetical protein
MGRQQLDVQRDGCHAGQQDRRGRLIVKPTRVPLDEADRVLARACAAKRLDDAIRACAKDNFGENSLDSHYWGALGEIAVAKFLGEPWDCPSRVWAVPDVGGYEVRSVRPGLRLYIKAKENDPSDRKVLLVAHTDGTEAIILGWMTAGEIAEKVGGLLSDWGNRGAKAYMLTSLYALRSI